MVSKSPDTGIEYGFTEYSKLVSKLVSGQAETIQILQDDLGLWEAAGRATSFAVKQIAVKGQTYPGFLIGKDGKREKEISQIMVLNPDYVAISMEKPEDFTPLWKKFKRLEYRRVRPSPKSRTKS